MDYRLLIDISQFSANVLSLTSFTSEVLTTFTFEVQLILSRENIFHILTPTTPKHLLSSKYPPFSARSKCCPANKFHSVYSLKFSGIESSSRLNMCLLTQKIVLMNVRQKLIFQGLFARHTVAN